MRMITTLLLVLLLCSCAAGASDIGEPAEYKPVYTVSRITKYASEVYSMRGVWLSQFDMHPVYRDGGKQRDAADFTEKVKVIFDNLKNDGYNAVFLQVRPNGDSMYESKYYPASKYIAGVYGGDIAYDAVEIIVSEAKEHGIAIHAWINPLRLCEPDKLDAIVGEYKIAEWRKNRTGQIVECEGMLYLNPAYAEVRELITAGAREICEKYAFDGLHMDDYFYPTEGIFDDEAEFAASEFSQLGDFRRENINALVKSVYETAHNFGMQFGISPAGNIYSLSDHWYADVYLWCAEEGYIDYIMPQLYFGFKNAYCPFETILADWVKAMKNKNIRLYIGLSAAKEILKETDIHAGTEFGKNEWKTDTGIIARSVAVVKAEVRASGYCFFSYSYIFDVLTGEKNPDFNS